MNNNQSKKSKQGKKTPKTNKNSIARNLQNRQRLQPRANLGNFQASRGIKTVAFVAKSKQTKTNRPIMTTLRNGDCHVVHREYLQDVLAQSSSPSLFSVASVPINPGQASTFPWLSKIAQNFESYVFKKLRFCYETEAPSSLGGTLVLAVDYDASDPLPLTKQQMLAYRGSVRSAPWTECSHISVPEDLHKLKTYFVRAGVQPNNTDIKFYDVGQLFVATQGVTTGSAVCGELYVEYDIELKTPIYEIMPASGALYNSTGTGCATSDVMGTTGVSTGNIGVSNALNVVTLTNMLPGAEYVVSSWVVGASVSGNLVIGTVTGGTLKTLVDGTASANLSVESIASLNCTATTMTFVISGVSGITTPSAAGIVVTQVANMVF
jgi:hypothetical protein